MAQAQPRTWPQRRPRRRLSNRTQAWLLVGLLHLAVVLSIWKLPVWADRMAPVVERPPLVVTLWERARPANPTVRPAAPSPRRDRTPAAEPQAITPPAPSVQEPPPALAAPALTPQAPPAESIPPPLNLALPRSASAPWRQRSPALDDPRSNTAKLTMEQKLANAMGGDGIWAEERVDLDHIRYRRGDQCILATRTRAGQLELANGAFRDSWMVREC